MTLFTAPLFHLSKEDPMLLFLSWFERLIVVSVSIFDDGGDPLPPWPPK